MSAAVAEAYVPSEAPKVAGARVHFGSIEIDCVAYAVWTHGVQVVLTARERRLVVYLAERIGRLVTREELISQVWGPRYDGGPRTVDIHVSRVRRKLGPELPLVTLRGVGYRLDPATARALENGAEQ